MRFKSALTVVTATAFVLGGSAAAMANTEHNGVCESHELCLYYNSNLGGSMHDFDNEVSNFGTYKFLTTGNGKGTYVKNNAASARNKASVCNARIYYNSGFSGVYDEVVDETWRNLDKTYNENASFNWPGAFC